MLNGLDPLLNANWPGMLGDEGHSDDIVLADTNFPTTTMTKRVVRMPGLSAPRVLETAPSVMPLDDFVDQPCGRTEMVGDPNMVPEVGQAFQDVIDRTEGGDIRLAKIERFDFHQRAREVLPLRRRGKPGAMDTSSWRWAWYGRIENVGGRVSSIRAQGDKNRNLDTF